MNIFTGHIEEIKKEKALLTSTLPSLARATSDDDLLSTTDLDGEGSLDDLSSKDIHKEDGTSTSSPASAGVPHLQRFPTNSSTGDDEVAVKYNLREQFIDYIPSRVKNANTNIPLIKNGSGTEVSDRRGSDLQRQKPIVMRSISGGYESPKTCSAIGLQRAATTMDTSSNNDEDDRNSKSQSMDDEPIMV